MSEKGKNRKPLLIGVIAAVVILAALLAVLLMQCGGGGNVTPPTSQTTTAPTEPVVIGDGRLYWNVDRALYDGMSEGGMSSRSAGSDGYFHIRFFVDGEMVELLAEDRRTVNNIEARDLMGFVLEGNVIKEVIPIEDMNHVQKVGWKFYVQSTGGTLIKVNSSDKFNGMEMILDTKDGGKVYDMTGTFGEIGSESEAVMNDRVMGVADLDGKLLAVYIYDRSNMVIEFDAHCQHCDKTVTWIEWDKDNTLPVAEGHYKLTKDIQLKAQQSIGADAKICLDLNGKTVNGAEGKRVYSLHNMNCELAIMDTSENKDGRLVAHGESASQGLVVWVRYGVFYLYGGILDATDATTTNLGGANVYVAQDRFFYMYGGEVVGGTAKYKLNESSGQYANGTGGAIYIRGGKFVMNDGVIRDGVAQSVATWADGETVYKRGNGGNLFVSGGVFEMNGGVIEGGKAGTGGNIFLDGTTEFTMNGGQIKNGVLTDPGRNGGNIYINSKVKAVINDGRISGGVSYNASGNIHLAGTLTMNGGVISGGRIIDPETGKNMPTKAHRNMYVGNGAKFYMSGGWIYGGVAAVDSNAEDGKKTTVVLSGVATIADGPEGSPNLTLMAGKEPVKVIVGPMLSFSKIGVTAAGIFSEETDESNLAHFFSDVEGVDVLYTDKRLALGVIACLCGVNSEKAEDHIGECKGEKLLWQPWTSTNSLPSAEGNYFLVDDVTVKSQIAVGTMNGDQVVNLNLNGKIVTSEERAWLVYSELNVVDHVGGGQIVGVGRNTGKDHTGVVLLYGGSEMNLYSGTIRLADKHYNITNGGVLAVAEGASFTMYGGVIDGRSADTENTVGLGGAVRLSGSMTVVDGTIYGGKVTNGGAFYIEKKGSLTVQGGTIVGGTAQQQGGSIYITGENAKLTLSGGVLDGGSATEGGVIRLLGKATVNIEGGTVQNGTTTGVGGNISVASGSLTIDGTAQIKDGSAGDVGGNIFLSGGKLYLKGGTVSGGQVKGATDNHSANICVRNAAEAVVSGGTVKGGFLVYNTNKENAVKITLSGSPVITCEETYGLRLFNVGEGTVVPVIEVSGKLEDGASVTVNTLGVITGETTEENVDNFHSTLDYVDVVYYDKSIALGRLSCLCGEQDCIGECDGTGLLWQPWTAKDSLPTVAGNYYLVNDVTKSGQMYIGDAESGQAVNLNLNGKSITGAQRAFAVNGLVNIVDHVGGSQIVGAGPKSGTDHTGVVVVNAGGELNLYSGTIRLADKHYKLTNGGVVSVVEGAEMTMYGGVIDGRSAETENTVGLGGAVRLSGTMTVVDGTIYGGEAANGGTFYIEKKGSLTVQGGTVYGGTAQQQGGSIYITGENAKLTLSGGVLDGGSATDGGVIRLLGSATVNIEGGTVQNGTTTGAGGNISMVSGSLTIDGKTEIKDGSAGTLGGNIFLSGGTLYLKNGTVSGGKAKETTDDHSANICVQNATVNVSGGTVEGNFLVMNTSEQKEASITITGNPQITSPGTYGLELLKVSPAASMPVIQLPETLDGSASIAIYNVDCYISGATVAENAERFVPRNGYGVEWDESGLYVGVSACLCGKEEHESWCTHETDGDLIWRPWDGKSNITGSGNYYLKEDTTSTLISIGGRNNTDIVVNLNLNGNTITGVNTSDRVMNVYGTLNLVDHDPENGGKLIGVGAASLNHSAVAMVQSGAVLNLYDGTLELSVSHEKLSNNGGMVTVLESATMNIWSDGLVDASASLESTNTIVQGGAIRVRGTLNLKGGKIYGGKVTTNGGALYINGGTVNVEADSEISGGVAGQNGGNIYMTVGTLNLLGGTVSGGAAGQDGGNISLTGGTLNLESGTVSGGMVAETTANVSANISVYDAAVNISGGTVEGGFLVANSTPDHETQITISGNPIISRVNGYGLLLGQTVIAEEIPMITLGELTGASIAIDNTGYITEACETDYSDVFHPTEGNGVEYDDTKCLYVGRAMCLCGASKTGGTHTDWCALEENKTLIWRPWDGNSTITSGNYYLTESITNGETLTINGTVNLDLNGTTYTAKTRAALLTQGDSLRIVDSVGTGTMIGKGAVNSGTGGVLSSNNGKIYLFAGTFKLAEQHNRITDGGVVVVSNPSGELHIYDGVVIDASTATGVVANGGAIRLMKGKIYIHGGTIYGYSGITGFGSAIYVKEGGEVYAYGGSIARGDVYIDDSTLTVDGKPSIEKVTLPKDMKITVEDTLDAENASIGIDMAVPGVFADGVTTDLSGAFVSGTTGYDVFYSVVNENLSLIKTHSHCWCEGAENAPEHSCLDNQKWKPIEKKKSDKKVVNEGGHYYLNWTGRSAQSIEVTTTEDVYICLNGAKIYARSPIVLCEGANVYICDCSANKTGIIATSDSSQNAPIYLDKGAALNLVSGTVDSENRFGAVVVNHQNAVFNMYGGTITGGKVDGNGDNIHLIAGEVNISGGSVSFSGDEYDILVEGGSFNVSGDTGLNKLYQTGGSVIADGSNNQMIIELFCQGGSMTVTGMGYIETLHVAGGNVSVGGAVQIVTLYLAEGQTVNILEEGLNADIGISMEVPGVIADVSDTLRASFLKRFTSLNEGQTIGLNDGNLVMGAEADHQHCYCINAEVVPEDHVCNTLLDWSPVASATGNKDGRVSGAYFLNWNGKKSAQTFAVNSEATVYLCLNGSEIYGQTVVTLTDKSVLYISDCAGGGKIRPSNANSNTASPITLSGKSTVYLYSGKIDGDGKKPSVNISSANGTFHMYGGLITGGKNTGNGGNVTMSQGTFNMYGGEISGGSAENGGNVALTGGTAKFNMYNGVISGGQSSANGGNISLSGGNTVFTMYGGTITAGEATTHGGNVVMTRGTFIMNDGTISAGKAVKKGGNVMLVPASNATPVFELHGGSIKGDLTEGYNAEKGGNVCVSASTGSATFRMTGGSVTGGAASAEGGNIYIYKSLDTIEITDGTVSGGSAVTGKDVFVNGEEETTTIMVGNKAVIGEVYLAGSTKITVSSEMPLTGDASIGVVTAVAPAVDTPVVIAAGATSAQGFTTTMSGCIVDYVDGNVVLKLAE